MNAVRTIRRELNGSVPLIGFSGSPWTLATYMVEGGGSKDHARVKAMAYDQPELMHKLLSLLADAVADYLCAQIDAGAQAVQIFDTWGGSVECAAGLQDVLAQVHAADRFAPARRGGWTSCAGHRLYQRGRTVAAGHRRLRRQAVGIDWTTDIASARAAVGDRVALQGNMDPSMLFASPARIRDEVASILEGFGHGPGHVFNLGHGITPGVNPDHVAAFVDAVHELSPQYHKDD